MDMNAARMSPPWTIGGRRLRITSLDVARPSTPDLDAAARFLAGNARVLARRRFERLCSGGDARPVRDAVAAFRNSDGGFGHALEPDGRTPASQPHALGRTPPTGSCDETDRLLLRPPTERDVDPGLKC